jgi:NitT/TauT family transport system substrate-binding protein
VANDALISGRADFVAAGPPAFLALWDRGRDSLGVRGVAAMTSMPMYLNTRAAHLLQLDDVGPQDKVAVTAVKVSIPAIVMQMYARQRYGRGETRRFDPYTVSMAHPDGLTALRSGVISAHFTSPPFHQCERQTSDVRTVMSSDEVLGGPATFTMLYTTRAFHERRPEVYAAVLAALVEANKRIVADPRAAAELLPRCRGERPLTLDEMVALLKDPAIRFTTTPENVMKYATFMHAVGTLDSAPLSWTELFFPEIHNQGGS